MVLHLFAKFDLHPANTFWENRCWNDEYGLLNMIGAKLRDHRNSKHADHFKFTNLPREVAALWFYTSALSILCQDQQTFRMKFPCCVISIVQQWKSIERSSWLMFAWAIRRFFSPSGNRNLYLIGVYHCKHQSLLLVANTTDFLVSSIE